MMVGAAPLPQPQLQKTLHQLEKLLTLHQLQRQPMQPLQTLQKPVAKATQPKPLRQLQR
jgi:hypothetical protein